jgi:tetratricopeptide (TPR) repeat protein
MTVMLKQLGDAKLQTGDAWAGAASYDEALAIARRLAARDPGNALWQSDPWIAFYKLGEAKLSLGDTAAARGFYADGLPIIRRLVSADPGNLQRQINLVFNLYRLASVQDGFERKHALKEALAIVEQLQGQSS